MMEKFCGIYKIVSPLNRIYIGQSIDIKTRWVKYKSSLAKTQPRLNRSFLKHGIESHKFEIIQTCSKEELNNLEIYYIELFNCFNSKYGLNLCSGGNFGTISDESRKKLINAAKKRKHQPHTIEKLRQIALVRFKNKPMGQDGKKASEETRKLMSSKRKGKNNARARPDYEFIRDKAKEMRSQGFTYREMKEALKIKSNGHLVNLFNS